jgi:hypothetical protein
MFKNKYLKYKIKYLNLKGGADSVDNWEDLADPSGVLPDIDKTDLDDSTNPDDPDKYTNLIKNLSENGLLNKRKDNKNNKFIYRTKICRFFFSEIKEKTDLFIDETGKEYKGLPTNVKLDKQDNTLDKDNPIVIFTMGDGTQLYKFPVSCINNCINKQMQITNENIHIYMILVRAFIKRMYKVLYYHLDQFVKKGYTSNQSVLKRIFGKTDLNDLSKLKGDIQAVSEDERNQRLDAYLSDILFGDPVHGQSEEDRVTELFQDTIDKLNIELVNAGTNLTAYIWSKIYEASLSGDEKCKYLHNNKDKIEHLKKFIFDKDHVLRLLLIHNKV